MDVSKILKCPIAHLSKTGFAVFPFLWVAFYLFFSLVFLLFNYIPALLACVRFALSIHWLRCLVSFLDGLSLYVLLFASMTLSLIALSGLLLSLSIQRCIVIPSRVLWSQSLPVQQNATPVKNLLFLARLEFVWKTGCVPHDSQYKRGHILIFFQNLSQIQ